jgi:hypothetical protein
MCGLSAHRVAGTAITRAMVSRLRLRSRAPTGAAAAQPDQHDAQLPGVRLSPSRGRATRSFLTELERHLPMLRPDRDAALPATGRSSSAPLPPPGGCRPRHPRTTSAMAGISSQLSCTWPTPSSPSRGSSMRPNHVIQVPIVRHEGERGRPAATGRTKADAVVSGPRAHQIYRTPNQSDIGLGRRISRP